MENYRPIPIKMLPQYKVTNNCIELMIQFVVNPIFTDTPIDIRIKVIPKIVIDRVQSKPEAIWSDQILEWKLNNILPTKETIKLFAKLYPNHIIDESSQILSIKMHFICNTKTLSKLTVEGCDGKKSKTDEIFIGGLKRKLIGNFDFTFTK